MINIIYLYYLSNCINYSNHPNLFFIVKSNKNIDDKDTIKPIIIIGFDFSFALSSRLVDEALVLSLDLLI
ncbi:Hypothetical protein P9515_10771 [Prochlorococcus marinus str. MIT 9515]|uniref:Uncharacterized protein n=1 Tax=Prochlorococcus marinus (strain MIT 9515) TaxID=167542 RepID=A2BWX3_PROM5|nr:Hypothetical protein P9515_10771 [Prochlorococcus marinus str. MIT 9515]